MILKCAQRISLSEHSHPPKLIKSYIAISCLIKATLCSENPAQLSNGCYSMKTDCIFLLERGEKKRKKKKTTYSIPNGLQGIEPAKMCQDGEVSISRFNGDLCSSWKPCESMTARQIKLPCPGLLRHVNWHWLGWLCPNHQFCFSSSMASSWTEELQTIDTLHIFQQWTCYWSLWLWTLLSFSPCCCGWNLPAVRDKQSQSQRKTWLSLYIYIYFRYPETDSFITRKCLRVTNAKWVS